jgi:hypothetical protein
MTQPMAPSMLCEPEVLAYRSKAPVDGRVAARLAETILRPAGSRTWVSLPPSRPRTGGGSMLPRFLFGEVWVDPQACAVYADVLWLLCQLARCARDERIEFEIQLGAAKGCVSTGGLDAGAQRILQQAQGETNQKPLLLRERRPRRAAHARAG